MVESYSTLLKIALRARVASRVASWSVVPPSCLIIDDHRRGGQGFVCAQLPPARNGSNPNYHKSDIPAGESQANFGYGHNGSMEITSILSIIQYYIHGCHRQL